MRQAACFRVGRQPRARDADAASRCARVRQQGAAGWAGLTAGFKCGVCRGSYCCGIDQPELLQWRLRATCSVQCATCSVRRAAYNVQRAACRSAARNAHYAPHGGWTRCSGAGARLRIAYTSSDFVEGHPVRSMRTPRRASLARTLPASRQAGGVGGAARLGMACDAPLIRKCMRACTRACVRAC
jgi:hypothetical protein